jgi:hypothetical protein
MRLSALRSAILLTNLAVAVLATEPAVAQSRGSFLPPLPARPTGQTYSAVAAGWWTWALTQPTATNPVVDPTGALCANGQSGNTWFLAGSFGGGTVNRTCTVPAGTRLVFPVINAAYFAFPTDPPDERTEAFIRAQANAQIQGATALEADVDGVAVASVGAYHELSDIFSVTLPADNVLGQAPGQVLDPCADEGWYVALTPLPPGKHTVHWHGEVPAHTADGQFFPALVVDATYQLIVSPGSA